MGVAKHVTAAAAMVSAFEEVERFLTDWGVADNGIRIRLPVLFRRRPCNVGEVAVLHHCLFSIIAKTLLFLTFFT